MEALVAQLNEAFSHFSAEAASSRALESDATPSRPSGNPSKSSARSSPSSAVGLRHGREGKPELLSIDEAEQVKSERVTPRASAIPSPLLPHSSGSERDDTHTLPMFLATDGKKANAATSAEVELYRAAENICHHISGVNYRLIASQATRACDIAGRMMKEELSVMSQSEWIPAYLVARHLEHLRGLFEDTKGLLSANGIAVPPTLVRLAAANPYGISPSTSPGPSGSRLRSVSVDAAAAGGGKGTRSSRDSGSGAGGLQMSHGRQTDPAVEEAYDLRVMHEAFDDRSDAHTRELEDELIVLKTRIERLQKDKKELMLTVERQEGQLASMRSKLTKETEAIYITQRQMQADLRQLAVTTGHRELLGSDDDMPSPSEQMQAQRPRPPAFPPPVETSGRQGDAFNSPPPAVFTVGGGDNAMNRGQQQQQPTKDTDDDQASAAAAAVVLRSENNSEAHRHSNETHSDATSNLLQSKYNRLDNLYTEVYKGRAMEFLWCAVDLVFKLEYDSVATTQQASSALQSVVLVANSADCVSSSHKSDAEPPTDDAVSAPATVNNGGGGSGLLMPGGSSDRQKHLQDAYSRMKQDIEKHVLSRLTSFETFREASAEVIPLRSEYVAYCVQHRCKPNSGVVALFSTFTQDRDVEVLNLSGNYLGDAGVAPLVPLLQRLYRLHTLRLADNGIKNSGVRVLCHALRNHGCLTDLDLSGNTITRSAGRDLLGLVSSLPNLKRLELSHTHIDAPLIEKIQRSVSVKWSTS